MIEHIGLNAFSEVLDRFKLFCDPVFVATESCKTFITGGLSPEMNYVYDLDVNNLKGLANDFSQLAALHVPMLVLCETETANSLNDFFEENGLNFLGLAQSKYRELADFFYIPSGGIKIKEVSTLELFYTWRNISATGFGYPRECDENLFKNFMKPGGHHEFIKLFLAYIEDIAVGQSMLVFGEHLPVNMWGSVLPEYRRRGVLTEMVSYHLNLTKKLGFDITVVQCMPMSASVCDKLGYQNKEKINLYMIPSD